MEITLEVSEGLLLLIKVIHAALRHNNPEVKRHKHEVWTVSEKSEKQFGLLLLLFFLILQGPDCMGKDCMYGWTWKTKTMTSWHKCDTFPHNKDTIGINHDYSTHHCGHTPEQQMERFSFFFKKSPLNRKTHQITVTCQHWNAWIMNSQSLNNDHIKCLVPARPDGTVQTRWYSPLSPLRIMKWFSNMCLNQYMWSRYSTKKQTI